MFGLGSASKDWGTALNCLRDASERGSVYATGMLSLLYFRRALYTLASRTAYSLVGNMELRNSIMVDARDGGGESGRGVFDIQTRRYIQRGLTVACFIYATCLDRGLGIQQDRRIASTMYSRVSSHQSLSAKLTRSAISQSPSLLVFTAKRNELDSSLKPILKRGHVVLYSIIKKALVGTICAGSPDFLT